MKLYKDIYKNSIQPFKMILEFYKGNIPQLNIHLGSLKSKLAIDHYISLNKKHPIFRKHSSGTMGVAVIGIRDYNSFSDYEKTLSGPRLIKNYRRCHKLGYYFNFLDPNEHIDEIHDINTSSSERQGKRMAESYLKKVDKYEQEEFIEYAGVFNKEGRLVSYLGLLFLNEAVFITKWLGHKLFLKDKIQILLVYKTIEQLFYKRESKYKNLKFIIADSFFTNSEGLSYFKKQFGFSPFAVKWLID